MMPTHTRRSEESQQLQQFSTPVELAFIASLAAGITPGELVLEPSAGTGQLAFIAELRDARLALNEIAQTRADLLARLFSAAPVTRFDAQQIHDYLPAQVRPTIVLMNPPFSAAPLVKGRLAGTDLRHLRCALLRLPEGGRLVAITGINAAPGHPDVREALRGLELRFVFSAGLSGALYRRHGTTAATRLTVIDRIAGNDAFDAAACHPMADTAEALLDLVTAHVPPRPLPAPAIPDPVDIQPALFAPANSRPQRNSIPPC